MRSVTIVVLLIVLLADVAYAEKMNSIGLSSYTVNLNYSLPYSSIEDDVYNGIAIVYQRALSHHFAISGKIYGISHEEDSDSRLTGYSLGLLVGSNFDEVDYKYYASIGYFNEVLDPKGVDIDYSGMEYGIGLGLNLEIFSIDLTVTARESTSYESKYEKQFGLAPDIAASTTQLAVSVRY